MDDGYKKIKILHAVRSLEFGGAEKMVVDLSAIQKESGLVEPFILCIVRGGPLTHRATELGLKYSICGMESNKYLSPAIKIYRQIKKFNIDIVHTHNFVSHFRASIAAKISRVPIIHTKHGRAVNMLQRFPVLRRLIYNFAEKIVVVSEDTREIFIEKTGIVREKTEVIYNGIGINKFSISRVDGLREKLDIGESDIIFGSVSRLDPVKDHLTLVRAFAKVCPSNKNIKLLIIGDGPERERIEKMIEKLSIKKQVKMVGFSDDIPSFLSIMDLFLQPSLEEGFSLTILEAMAAGVPVVSTPVGGTPEIIREGETGTLVPAGDVKGFTDVMNKFLSNREHFQSMAKRAKENVSSNFSLDSMADNYLSLYYSILTSR